MVCVWSAGPTHPICTVGSNCTENRCTQNVKFSVQSFDFQWIVTGKSVLKKALKVSFSDYEFLVLLALNFSAFQRCKTFLNLMHSHLRPQALGLGLSYPNSTAGPQMQIMILPSIIIFGLGRVRTQVLKWKSSLGAYH